MTSVHSEADGLLRGSQALQSATAASKDAQAMPKNHRKTLVTVGAVVTILAVLGVLLWYFRGRSHRPEVASQASHKDVPRLDGTTIRFSPDFARRSGMKTAPAGLGDLIPTVTVTGTVRFDPKLVAAIGARISGRVRKTFKVPGDRVTKGEALAEIESAELGKAQSAALSARAHAQAAIANEKRERHLAEAKVSSERDAELAHANAEAARADLHAAEQAVQALAGGGLGAEMGVLVLRSPIAGKVIDSNVYQGQTLEPSNTAFRVADLSRLWVELAVFERELGAIRAGDPVELSPQTERRQIQKGRVAYVGDVIDENARSAPVRIEVDNAEGKLRPGQSVVAHIQTTTPATQVLNLPMTAVARIDGVPTVFVALGETGVESRKVELGVSDGNRVQILSGVNAGENVVIEGVFAIKSELFR